MTDSTGKVKIKYNDSSFSGLHSNTHFSKMPSFFCHHTLALYVVVYIVLLCLFLIICLLSVRLTRM